MPKPSIVDLSGYQLALDTKFGKGVITALKFVDMKTEVRHRLLKYGGKIGISKPSRLIYGSNIKKYPEVIIGINPHYEKKKLATYQDELDCRYGIGVIIAVQYLGHNTPSLHRVGKRKVTATPNTLLHSKDSNIVILKGGRLQYNKADEAKFHADILKLSDGHIYCKHTYRGSNKSHDFVCNRCKSEWTLSKCPLSYSKKLKCPKCDYLKRHSQSAIRWIAEIAKRYRLRIQHAGTRLGEKKLRLDGRMIWVDGFSTKYGIVFEFYGDVFHGNPVTTKPNSSDHPFNDLKNKELYRNTIAREASIEKLGYKIVRIWENEFNDKKEYSKWLKLLDKTMAKYCPDKNFTSKRC